MRSVSLAAMTALLIAACGEGQARQGISPTQAQAEPRDLDVGSANYITAGCRDFIARSANLNSAYAQGLCAGKVETVAVFATGICYPAEATVGQMIRVVVRYTDERPARLHESFLILAHEAMRAAWPCRR